MSCGHQHPDDLSAPSCPICEHDAEIEKLRAENAELASWQCLFFDGSGLTGDEHGNQVCMKQRALDAVVAENERLRRDYDRLLEHNSRACVRAEQAEDQRDAAIARAERAEAVLSNIATNLRKPARDLSYSLCEFKLDVIRERVQPWADKPEASDDD